LHAAAVEQSLFDDRDLAEIKEEMRYSYAGSPLFYHYAHHFTKVGELFLNRPSIDKLNQEE